MKSNEELRLTSRERLSASGWFGRMLGAQILLGIATGTLMWLLWGLMHALGIQDWFDVREALMLSRLRPDQASALPAMTGEFVLSTSLATLVTAFFQLIMAGIVAFGMAHVQLHAVRDEAERYLGDAFGGFRDPFGMFAMRLRLSLIYLGWALVVLVPAGCLGSALWPRVRVLETADLAGVLIVTGGLMLVALALLLVLCVPFYRYRYLFLVKAEHPAWRTSECVGECRRLMAGNLLRSFRLDCAFWREILKAMVPLVVLTSCMALLSAGRQAGGLGGGATAMLVLGLLVLFCIAVYWSLKLAYHLQIAQAMLYRELAQAGEPVLERQ